MVTLFKTEKTVQSFALLIISFYALWGFLFTKTVFARTIFEYVFFLGAFGLFLLCVFLSRCTKVRKDAIIWIPYVLYSMMGYLFRENVEYFIYWSICCILLLLASNCDIFKFIPYRFYLISGFIAIVGQGVQLLLPNIYTTRILPLFQNNDQISYWGSGYGIAGFTYQLDTTAMIIVVAEAIFIYAYTFNEKNRNTWRTYLFSGLLLCGIFLAGKRMLFLISILAPALIFLFTEKNSNRKIRRILFFIIAICSIGIIFMNNIEFFIGTRFFSRFATTFLNLSNHADITTGRGDLYELALDAFKNHPIIGIGVGNFISYTGSDTAVHNTYLQVLCEQGIIGFCAFVIPIIAFLVFNFRDLRNCNNSGKKFYLRISLFFQLVYALYALTENVNVNLYGFIMYFIGISIYISTTSSKLFFQGDQI